VFIHLFIFFVFDQYEYLCKSQFNKTYILGFFELQNHDYLLCSDDRQATRA